MIHFQKLLRITHTHTHTNKILIFYFRAVKLYHLISITSYYINLTLKYFSFCSPSRFNASFVVWNSQYLTTFPSSPSLMITPPPPPPPLLLLPSSLLITVYLRNLRKLLRGISQFLGSIISIFLKERFTKFKGSSIQQHLLILDGEHKSLVHNRVFRSFFVM